MSFETFKAALANDDESVCLGGGEPTLHPEFWKFMGYALGRCDNIWLATNGKLKEDAIALARMAKRGIIACALSQDDWHEDISPDVVLAFTQGKKPRGCFDDSTDYREIRTVTSISASGRAAKWGDKSVCCCEEYFVEPSGTVRQCGCKGSTILGNVHDGFRTLDDGPTCYKSHAEVALELKEA
jgi:MoaA/NifB/PqqE/SkfB family radical SAM enzyme